MLFLDTPHFLALGVAHSKPKCTLWAPRAFHRAWGLGDRVPWLAPWWPCALAAALGCLVLGLVAFALVACARVAVCFGLRLGGCMPWLPCSLVALFLACATGAVDLGLRLCGRGPLAACAKVAPLLVMYLVATCRGLFAISLPAIRWRCHPVPSRTAGQSGDR